MAKRHAPSLPSPSKTAAETRAILARLRTQHPGADTELHFRNPYELLVATILSAQCTDERVNQVTPALFARYPDARALVKATTDELELQIQSTGFFRAKSRSLTGMAAAVVQKHGGEIPKTMEGLVDLPGVGRKTANVVLGHALGVPGLPVDRHVLRVANRIGIARSDDPAVVEQQLGRALPPEEWTVASDTLILHGRRICKPKPLCDRCAVRQDCDYFRSLGAKTSVKAPKARGTGRGRGAQTDRSLNGSPVVERRAPKARGTGRGGGAPRQSKKSGAQTDRSLNGSPMVERRAPKARGTGRADGAKTDRSLNGSPVVERRAPKARGTGRGGGAPRQSKK